MAKSPIADVRLSKLASRVQGYVSAHFPISVTELLSGMKAADAALTNDKIISALAEIAKANTIQVKVRQEKTGQGIDYRDSLIIPKVSSLEPTIF
jgi:hypothetical protein